MKELSFNLGLDQTPIGNRASDIFRLYNSVQLLAYYLDQYTGAAPVRSDLRPSTPVSTTSRLAQVNSGYAEAATNILSGDLCSFDSNGKLILAQSNGTHNLKCRCLALEDIPSGNFGKYLLGGVTTRFGGLVPGSDYYLSTIAGALGSGIPSAGNTLQYVGYAITAGQLYFNPEVRHSIV